ncbi:TetR family transcriptional regulator C-terminal domain-containing protein [Planococcus sp. APC 4015]|nr:TetR family transcriptional regulator C-terminal domain-containing protein [Planococcus sp. APC 4015]
MTSKVPVVRSRRSPDERRAEIADAARRIALTRGPAAVTLRSVATEAGVAPALVAHYTPSMEDVVATAFATIVADELIEIEQLVSASGDALPRMQALLSTLLDDTRADVTLVWVQAWSLGSNEALAAEVRIRMDDWAAFIEAEVRAGVASGVFSTRDPAAVARQMLGMIDGLNAHALVQWGPSLERRELMGLAVEAMLGVPTGALRA